MSRLLHWLQKNFIYVSVYIVAALISIGIITSYNTKLKIDTLAENRAFYDTMYVHYNIQYIDIIRALDVGIRGFAITRDTVYLDAYRENGRRYKTSTDIIDSVMRLRNYPFEDKMRSAMQAIKDYESYILEMERQVRENNMERFYDLLREDRGKALWHFYYSTWIAVRDFETQRVQQAEADLQLAFALNRSFQLLLLIIGIPLLIWLARKLQRDALNREQLLQQLDYTNRTELFNDGKEKKGLTPSDIINNVTQNMKQAEFFIRCIAEGKYDITWDGLTPENAALNTTNVVGELLQLRDKLARVSHEEARRKWAAEGISQFNDLLRKYQYNLNELSVQALSFIVRYTGSLQGALFIEQVQNDTVVLQMSACYAYERIKAIQRHVAPGEGLVGQVYLEKQLLHIAKIPANYTAISAGLGVLKPSELLLLPLKTNELVEGVIELATLSEYDKETILFLERIAESLAAAIAAQKNAEQNRILLEQLKQQTEIMRAQEEELRQNMEELHATHESLSRTVAATRGEDKQPRSTY
ncbi:GAF domain-containing protein [Rhodoflexus sp.]